MHTHESLPRARKDGLLEETVGEELLLYDRDSHTAHCLSSIAAGVWRHCDGERNISELAELTEANEELVANALYELHEKDLLAAEPELAQSPVLGISRREAISRVARIGAAAAAAPLIVSATAATPAMASSGEKGGCSCVKATDSTCCCCEDGQCITIGKSTAECNVQCANAGHKGSTEAGKSEMSCSS